MTKRDLERRLAAIVFTDIVGFSRIMNHDESSALGMLEDQRQTLTPIIESHGGKILKEMGDGLLIEFASSVNAVQAAIMMQAAIQESTALSFKMRIGIHLGDIVASGRDILGDGVNIASRVEPLADPGGICITQAVYDSIKSIVEVKAIRTENVELKNIEERYTIYKLTSESPAEEPQETKEAAPLFARVEVESVKDETNLLRAVARLWPFYLCVLLINSPVLLKGDWFWVVITLLMLVGGAFVLYQRTVRVTFADIRHVGVLLDILIVRMDYGLVEQSDKRITYLHAPADWKYHRFFSWVRAHDSLTVSFDGNMVRISGPNFHIRKVLGGIRKFGQVKLGASK